MTLTAPQLKAAQHGLLVLRVEPQPTVHFTQVTGFPVWNWNGNIFPGSIADTYCPHQPGDRIELPDDSLWSCFTCDYLGADYVSDDTTEACPNCGTHSGDGFGMAENDPRYRGAFVVERPNAKQAAGAADVAIPLLGSDLATELLLQFKVADWLWLLTGRWEGSE
jgi:hypothetical protein